MVAVAEPTVGALNAAAQCSTPVVDYDRERDVLFIRFGELQPAVSYDVAGEAWIRFVPATRTRTCMARSVRALRYQFTDDQQAWRDEVRTFLRDNNDLLEASRDWYRHWEEATEFNRRLGRLGWLAAHWPKEYGGRGQS